MRKVDTSLIVRLCLPQFAVGLFTTMLNNYLIYFYQPSKTSGIPDLIPQGRLVLGVLTIIGMIKAVGHIIDAVTDPLIAAGSDKSRHKDGPVRVNAYTINSFFFVTGSALGYVSPLIVSAFKGAGMAFFQACIMYYVTSLMGLAETYSVLILAISIAGSLLMYPLVNKFAKKRGKKLPIILGCIVFSAAEIVICFSDMLPGNRLVLACVFALFVSFPFAVLNVLQVRHDGRPRKGEMHGAAHRQKPAGSRGTGGGTQDPRHAYGGLYRGGGREEAVHPAAPPGGTWDVRAAAHQADPQAQRGGRTAVHRSLRHDDPVRPHRHRQAAIRIGAWGEREYQRG